MARGLPRLDAANHAVQDVKDEVRAKITELAGILVGMRLSQSPNLEFRCQ